MSTLPPTYKHLASNEIDEKRAAMFDRLVDGLSDGARVEAESYVLRLADKVKWMSPTMAKSFLLQLYKGVDRHGNTLVNSE